mmetsp:Transcript_108080/g.304448  ORF Transcript_108080/g.304448 Transcript_108080/m.304448 type:complete len:200 (+) Transcript_108080:121-720(+)
MAGNPFELSTVAPTICTRLFAPLRRPAAKANGSVQGPRGARLHECSRGPPPPEAPRCRRRRGRLAARWPPLGRIRPQSHLSTTALADRGHPHARSCLGCSRERPSATTRLQPTPAPPRSRLRATAPMVPPRQRRRLPPRSLCSPRGCSKLQPPVPAPSLCGPATIAPVAGCRPPWQWSPGFHCARGQGSREPPRPARAH